MALMSDEAIIGEEDVPLELRDPEVVGLSARAQPPLRQAVENLEKKMVKDALENHETDYMAAQFLGIHPATLWRKIVKYHIR